MKKITFVLAALVVSTQAWPQANVAATGEAIVAALNKRHLEGLLASMDVEAVSQNVLNGMGLSDADRETLSKGFGKALRNNIQIGLRTIESSKGTAKYLRSGTRDSKPYALLRYDLGDQGTDYVEYYLTPSGKVEDWYVHSMATLYSTSARLGLATVFKTDSMLFSLFGTRMASGADAKPLASCARGCRRRTSPARIARSTLFPRASARPASGRSCGSPTAGASTTRRIARRCATWRRISAPSRTCNSC
jgi:hypothetical protein